MSNVVQFSKLNPIQFHRASDGVYWLDSNPAHEVTQEYFNRWQQADKFKFQIDVDTNYYNTLGMVIALKKCGTGVIEDTFNINNSTYSDGLWRFTVSLTLPEVTGDYFIHVFLPHVTGGGHEDFYSEGINIKLVQENTFMLTYSSFGIVKDTWFIDNLKNEVQFYFRCPGGIQTKDKMPGCETNVYVDQDHSFSTLSSREYDTFKLTIGDNTGLPYPYVSLVNRILGSNRTLKIDDISVSKTGSNALEQVEHADKYTRGIWKVELSEENFTADGYGVFITEVTEDPVVFAEPIVYSQLDLSLDGTVITVYPGLIHAIIWDDNNTPIVIGATYVSASNYLLNLSDLSGDIHVIRIK